MIDVSDKTEKELLGMILDELINMREMSEKSILEANIKAEESMKHIQENLPESVRNLMNSFLSRKPENKG
jgi:hypothetical protein